MPEESPCGLAENEMCGCRFFQWDILYFGVPSLADGHSAPFQLWLPTVDKSESSFNLSSLVEVTELFIFHYVAYVMLLT